MKTNDLSIKVSIIGIIVNTVLCVIKLIVGYYSNSIAIIGDGYNNLSDIGNAILIFIAYKIANKPADKEHPYGHGRMEYMLSQGISLMVMIIGISLLKDSISRIINPQEVLNDPRILYILIFSLLVKLSLAYYYHHLYKKTNMSSLHAQTSDSLADSASNVVILLGYFFHSKVPYLDSIIGVIVSLIIIYTGFGIFKDMTSILLGESLSEDLYKNIEDIIKSHKDVKGYHDLKLHSYGLNKIYGTCDIELDGNISFIRAHEIMDTIENQIGKKYQIDITLHGDPVYENKKFNKYIDKIKDILNTYELSYHDFHYNKELDKYYLEVQVPYSTDIDEKKIKKLLKDTLNDIDIHITFDRY